MSESKAVIQIIDNVKRGDSSSFRLLVEKYQHMAFTLALNIVKDRSEAEEVTQDAFLKAFKNIHQFKGDAKFSSWLYRIVYNTSLTRLRKKRLETFSIEEGYEKYDGEVEHSGWDFMISKDQKRYIREALEMLEENDKTLISLYYLAEQSLEEIGDIMQIKKSTAKVQLHRARKKLHDTLQHLLKNELKTLV